MSENHITSKFGGKTPILYTASYKVFSTELTENLFFLFYILALDSQIKEEDKQIALSDLIERIYDPENVVSIKFVDLLKNESSSNLIFNVQSYERIFGQMTFCRYMDNFLCYLKDILVEVVNKQPSILKSSETEKLEDILSFENIQDLRTFIIEKKLKSLFYKNMDDISKFFIDKLGIDILGDSKDELNLLFKERNSIVHNRAKINEEIIQIYPAFKDNMNDQLFFTFAQLENLLIFLNNLVVEIDTKLIKKFNLSTSQNDFY